jgi:hypothetical protein
MQLASHHSANSNFAETRPLSLATQHLFPANAIPPDARWQRPAQAGALMLPAQPSDGACCPATVCEMRPDSTVMRPFSAATHWHG